MADDSLTVLSLRNVTRTGPWFWHGWEKNLSSALRKSLTETMMGKEPSEGDVKALSAFLETLESPMNPHRAPKGGLSEAAVRGEQVFKSQRAGCTRCHAGPFFTDGKNHEVGLASPNDVFKGYNPPSLRGIYDRVLYLHDGRARSLEEVLKGPHNPAKVTRPGELSSAELADLLEYLRSL